MNFSAWQALAGSEIFAAFLILAVLILAFGYPSLKQGIPGLLTAEVVAWLREQSPALASGDSGSPEEKKTETVHGSLRGILYRLETDPTWKVEYPDLEPNLAVVYFSLRQLKGWKETPAFAVEELAVWISAHPEFSRVPSDQVQSLANHGQLILGIQTPAGKAGKSRVALVVPTGGPNQVITIPDPLVLSVAPHFLAEVPASMFFGEDPVGYFLLRQENQPHE